ncbi:MAG: BatA domain-containing protein [Armatimonadetes bacterium]|nr:BatA domain-containing protein [Armatimonadota bacterium]
MFAHPEALWLLAAAPLPVLLHLLGTARPRDLVFPGVYLLRQMAARRRALRLRHLLLLLLRTAAIAVVALICAGPRSSRLASFVYLSPPAPPVVALDASMSMSSGNAMAWRQAVEFLQRLDARGQRPRLVLSPGQTGDGAADTVPAQPVSSQGALADAVLAAHSQGLLEDSGPLYVVTDLDVSTILPRRWPPGNLPVAATIIACAPPAPGIYAVRHRPFHPVAETPVTLSCYLRPHSQEMFLRVSADGAPVAAVRSAPGARLVRLPLGKLSQGQHTLKISARSVQPKDSEARAPMAAPVVLQATREYSLRVDKEAGVAVVAGGQAAQFLTAAIDPQGTGRPFFVTRLPGARLVVADGSVLSPAPDDLSACSGLMLFAGPTASRWLQAFGLHGDVKPAGPALPADQAQGLRIAADAPPAWRGVLEPFRPALESARFFRRARLELPSPWWVLARFSDGRPALAWSEAGRRPVLLVAFPPTSDAADLVASGAFAAFLHASLAEMLPTETAPTGELVDALPPAELAGARATAEEIRAAWGPATRVIDFSPGMELPAAHGLSDLTAIFVLLGLAVLGAEWILSRRLTAG